MSNEPWDNWISKDGQSRFAQLADVMEFEDHCEAAFREVIKEWAKPAPDATRVRHELTHSNVAIALANWSYRPESNRVVLRRFAESIPQGHTLDSIREYFFGSLAAFDMDLDTAIPRLQVALSSDVSSVVTASAETLGRIAAIRGDARTAYEMMHLAGDDNEETQLLESMIAPKIGRNEPCPCGSGKKFKHCHQGSGELTKPQRLKWLVLRIGRDLAEDDTSAIRNLVTKIFNDERTNEEIDEILADPFTTDIVFFEDDFARRYLDRYRSEMQNDDLELLEMLLATPRKVLAITNLEPLMAVIDGSSKPVVIINPDHSPDIAGDYLFGHFVELDGELVAAGLIMELEPEAATDFQNFLDQNPRPDATTLLRWLFLDE